MSIRKIAMQKLASYYYDDDDEDKIDWSRYGLEAGLLGGAIKVGNKYGSDIAQWGDKHVDAVINNNKGKFLEKVYSKIPKNKWVRGTTALLLNSAVPVAVAYGAGSALNKLTED